MSPRVPKGVLYGVPAVPPKLNGIPLREGLPGGIEDWGIELAAPPIAEGAPALGEAPRAADLGEGSSSGGL